MIEAYRIGVAMTLDTTRILGPLLEVLAMFERLQRAASRTQGGLNDMVASLRGAGRVANTFADAMERAAQASRQFQAPQQGQGRAGSGGGFPVVPALPVPVGGSAPRIAGPGAPLLLAAPGGSMPIPLTFPAERGPFPTGSAFVAGMGLSYAGAAAGGFVGTTFTTGAEVSALQAKMRSSRFTDEQIKQASAVARGLVGQVPGFGYAEGLDLILQNAAFTGDVEEAIKLAPNMAFNAQVLSLYGKRNAIAQIEAAARAGEITGLTGKDGKLDYAKFNDFINRITSVVVSGGGVLDIGKYLTGLRQFGSGAQSASTDFLTAVLPAYMKMMGEEKAGTALASLQQVMLSPDPKTRSTKYLKEQKRIGLRDNNGNIVKQDLLQQDVFGYTVGFLLPKLGAAGFTTPGDITKELYRLYPRQTVDRLMSEGIFNQAAIEKEAQRNREQITAGQKPLQELLAQNPLNQLKAFGESWKLFIATLADPNMGAATKALGDLAAVLRSLADFAKQHPDATRFGIDTAAGGAAVGAVAGGALMAAAPIVALRKLWTWFRGPGVKAAAGAGADASFLGDTAGAVAADGMLMRWLNPLALAGWEIFHPGAGNNEAADLETWRRENGYAPPPRTPAPSSLAPPGNGAPIPVVVTNGRDIADGTIRHIERSLNRPATVSPSSVVRINPYAAETGSGW